MDGDLLPPPHQRLLQFCPKCDRVQHPEPRQPSQLRGRQCHQEDHGHQYISANAAQPGHPHQCTGHDDGDSRGLPLQQGESLNLTGASHSFIFKLEYFQCSV